MLITSMILKMRYLFFCSFFTLVGCSDSALQDDINRLKNELSEAHANIEILKAQVEPEGDLVHLVMFKLRPDTDIVALIEEIKKLEGIEQLKDLEVGRFEDLGDKRALSDYDMTMTMSFDSRVDYEAYQKHPIHLALKKYVTPMVAGPPSTYDFLKK